MCQLELELCKADLRGQETEEKTLIDISATHLKF